MSHRPRASDGAGTRVMPLLLLLPPRSSWVVVAAVCVLIDSVSLSIPLLICSLCTRQIWYLDLRFFWQCCRWTVKPLEYLVVSVIWRVWIHSDSPREQTPTEGYLGEIREASCVSTWAAGLPAPWWGNPHSKRCFSLPAVLPFPGQVTGQK